MNLNNSIESENS